MNALDWSGNGSLTDEGIWLTAVLTFFGTLITIRLSQRRIAAQVDSIDANLNHVGEPEGDAGPTIGQRVAKIDDRLDRVETNLTHRADQLDEKANRIETHVDNIDWKINRIGADLRTLSFHMMEHIEDEAKRDTRMESTVRDMDRRQWEAHSGETQPD